MRNSWKRVTHAESAKLAAYAADHGLTQAADKFGRSTTAVRRACALAGTAPRPYRSTRAEKIGTARAILRQLGLTVQDLANPEHFPR